MFLQQRAEGGERFVTSASDLTAASACEFAFLRRVDAKLGRDVVVPPDDDAMLARAARLGDAHEERTLAAYREELGIGELGASGGVVEIPRPDGMSEPALERVAGQTLAALRGGAEVVFQATFFDPAQRAADAMDPEIGFVGFADFLRLTPEGEYAVEDTKLARRARVTALMQLAAYAEQLERIGVPVAPHATLILGDGARSVHRIADVAPVFRARRARLHRLILDRAAVRGGDGERASAAPLAWGSPGIAACGRCEVCAPEIERTRDPLLIAGIRGAQRDALRADGLDTIERVAEALPEIVAGARQVAGIRPAALVRIAAQAEAQLGATPGGPPPVRVVEPAALAAIPEPNPGDLFFDFEGDPLYREPGTGDAARWGIDYLFGFVDADERFTGLWAHDLDAERAALERFLALVAERRAAHPGMRIYHYAAYERTHLLSIAARHGVGEAAVDALLRDGVLVDLFPIVRRALLVGSRSYSIKKLEPLYMGQELRDEAGVTSAAQSVTEYADASAQLASADPAVRAAGQRRLDAIEDYNRYDCVSTLRLRDWLLGIARERGIAPAPRPEPETAQEFSVSSLASALAEQAATAADPRDRVAAALAGSAIDYHARERKSFWWEHFARLVDPIEDWAETRDVLVVDPERSRVEEPWHRPPRARVDRRILRLDGELAPGSSSRASGEVFLVYAAPAPFADPRTGPGERTARLARIVGRDGEAMLVAETLPRDAAPFAALPVAVTPGPPPNEGQQRVAIEEWGQDYFDALDAGEDLPDPVVRLLRRDPPRLRGDRPLIRPESPEALRAGGGDEDARTIGAVVASLRQLDRAALAVQGPPGTGKTYLAARVIRALAEQDGWRIGVVAQSHRVVENVLEGVVAAGMHPGAVGKVPQGGALEEGAVEPPYTVIGRNGHGGFLRDNAELGRGCVIGGTAWDFSNAARFDRRGLDLLVIDEAGQFSLAPTIAASVAAERLLLLGDPQQLPQVSQGTHPEPVDTSALAWVIGEHDTIPEDRGYFLAETRRMRPALADVVSELSYGGRLHAHPSAEERRVSGCGPEGLVWHPVAHAGNATFSEEEAGAVVALVRAALAGTLHDGEGARPLDARDVIVVAAYNAQVECVSAALAAAGLPHVRVGTVDRFQGMEAALAIVTLAASSPEDVPRGLEFLLMRNRLNVAISRAQWAAHLVSSERLGEGLPTSAEGLAALSGYLRLTERAARPLPAGAHLH
ncbi:bifunctional RecB family nuclease/DEAD/DEAH box helicase [Leucobacter sp. PH1c]|uniref:TM0106 family RecB-like putative nuclease n=1 Tax=Leucobacter sp. PH1c TaxID=1397278 RepID=UPI00046A6CA7|nr:bifunctional RecB family nuclease/DEAD/DEAH box helicase [Leucobacter sp. PH1c]